MEVGGILIQRKIAGGKSCELRLSSRVVLGKRIGGSKKKERESTTGESRTNDGKADETLAKVGHQEYRADGNLRRREIMDADCYIDSAISRRPPIST